MLQPTSHLRALASRISGSGHAALAGARGVNHDVAVFNGHRIDGRRAVGSSAHLLKGNIFCCQLPSSPTHFAAAGLRKLNLCCVR